MYKPITRKFQKRKVYTLFRDNISGADQPDMQLIRNLIKEFVFFLCIIDIFSEYEWVAPAKDKKGTKTFQKVLDESKRKPNKI